MNSSDSDLDISEEPNDKSVITLGSIGLFANRIVKSGEYINATIKESVKPLLASLASIAEQIASTTQPFLEILRALEEEYEIAEAEAAEVLRRYKWFISPSMPASFVFKVVRQGRQEGNQRGAINQLFVEYFSANDYEELTRLVFDWETHNLFEKRMKIFRDCVSTLKYANGLYNPSNVVLPTLIAQIDGILTDYLRQQGVDRSKRNEWRGWKEQFELCTTDQYLPDLANWLILDILFQRAWPGEPLEVPFTFSRHKIMHGEYTRYGRIDNTIRAFLILDFLSQL